MTRQNTLVAGLLLIGLATVARADPRLFLPPQPVQTPTLPETTQMPFDALPQPLREKVRSVLARVLRAGSPLGPGLPLPSLAQLQAGRGLLRERCITTAIAAGRRARSFSVLSRGGFRRRRWTHRRCNYARQRADT